MDELQRRFRDKRELVGALSRDMARQGHAVNPLRILQERLEFLVETLFPAFTDEHPPVDNVQAPANPERLAVELRWLDRLEAMHKQGLRESIASGITPTPGGLHVPRR